MKTKSKKDEFVIKMNNGEEVQKVKDYYCADNTDSWVHFNFAILHDDICKYSMLYDYLLDRYSNLPVISFDQWESLPEFPKPEYAPKDVAFKPVGYKFKYPKIKNVVTAILGDIKVYKTDNYDFPLKSSVYQELKDLQVLDLWCDKVLFEKESITLKSGITLSEDDIAEVKETLNNK